MSLAIHRQGNSWRGKCALNQSVGTRTLPCGCKRKVHWWRTRAEMKQVLYPLQCTPYSWFCTQFAVKQDYKNKYKIQRATSNSMHKSCTIAVDMIMQPITDKPRPRKYSNWSSSQAIRSKDRKARQDSPSTLTWVTLARIDWITKAPGNHVTDPTPDPTIAILPAVTGSHVWGVINYAKKSLVY